MIKSTLPIIATLSLVASAHAALTAIPHTNSAQINDNDSDGSGNGLGNDSFLIPGYFHSDGVENLHTGWSFLMSGTGAVSAADFSATVFGVAGTPDFNLDLHATRVSGTSAFVASDYETSAQVIANDFWTTADGTGTLSLDATGQAALVSYLDSVWSDGDYVFLTLKTDPLTVDTFTNPSAATRYVDFGANDSSGARATPISDATLSVMIPEPSSSALFLLGGLGLLARRKR